MRFNASRLSALILCTAALLGISPPAAVSQAVPRIHAAVDDSQRTTLKGNTHPLADPRYDQGEVDPAAQANHMLLVLKRSDEQEATLRKLIEDEHNPSSSSYRKWLKPGEFGQRFGVESSDLETVQAWLQSQGLTVNKTNAAKTVIDFSGTAGQVKSAFHTALHTYEREGIVYHANSSDPQIPTALAPVVKGIASLNDIRPRSLMQSKGRANFDPKTHKAQPLWNAPVCYIEPDGSCTLYTFYVPTPADIATQYGISSVYKNGTTGAGETIGIISDSNVDISNVQNYRKYFNVSNPDNLPQTIIDGEDPGQNGDAGEAYLDLEVSGALAPDATINLYVSSDTLVTSGLQTAIMRAVDDDTADVLSLSYGSCEQNLGSGGNLFFYYVWQQAAAQGQSVFVAAGDGGSAGCDYPSLPASSGPAVSGFASTPYNVAVGGTDFYYSQYAAGLGSDALNAQLAQYWGAGTTKTQQATLLSTVPEQPWNDYLGLNIASVTTPSNWAGAGGNSSCVDGVEDPVTGAYDSCSGGYPKPSWQAGPGVVADGTRDLPDVSLFAADVANYSFWPICVQLEDCTTYLAPSGATSVTAVGGTSAASPAMAGIMALIDQSQKGRQGNPNYQFYALAAQHPSTFHDVTVGSNNVVCEPSEQYPACYPDGYDANSTYHVFPAWPGYDMASGLGTPNVANIISNWGSAKLTVSTTTLTLTPATVPHGSPVEATVAVSSSGGTPTGSVALVSTSQIPGQKGQGMVNLTNGTGTTPVILPGGTYKVVANYPGDGTFGSSASAPVSVTVNPEVSKTTITAAAAVPNGEQGFDIYPIAPGSVIPYGDVLFVDASVAGTSGQGYASGVVTFTDAATGTSLGTANLNAAGTAELEIFRLSAGNHTIVASYSGDPSFSASLSASLDFSLGKGAAYVYPEDNTEEWGATVPVYAGQPFSVPFLVTGSYGLTPTGTATVIFGTLTQTVKLNSLGVGSNPDGAGIAVFTGLTPGTYDLTINYPGDSNYLPASSFPHQVTVVPAPAGLLPSTTTVTSSSSTVTGNGTFTLTATVTGNGTIVPTGRVYFYKNGQMVGGYTSPITLTNGSATFTMEDINLLDGTNQVSASYVGDAHYLASNSAYVPVNANNGDFSLTTNNQNVVIHSGATGTATLTVVSLQGLTGSIALACAPSSPALTCSFTPASIALAGDGSQSTATITINTQTTTSPASAAGKTRVAGSPISRSQAAGKWLMGGGASLALVLLWIPARRRRIWKALLALIVVAGLGFGATGCGGSGKPPTSPGPPTPTTSNAAPGNYTVLITASDAGVVHTLSVGVTVE